MPRRAAYRDWLRPSHDGRRVTPVPNPRTLALAVAAGAVVTALGVTAPALASVTAPALGSVAPAGGPVAVVPAATTATGKPTAGCPVGLSAVTLTTPAEPRLATAAPRLPGAVVTKADGSVVRSLCLGAQPTPTPAPSVPADRVVGGPRLAEPGVITDLPAGVPAPPDMPHVSYVLADLDTGQILAAKNAHARLLPASTLKTLTALVVIPALDPKTVVIGADEDTRADGTRVGITVGGRYTVDDLLNGLILNSGNDAAYALARTYGGRAKLLADMNAKAGALGAWDTVAGDPSGLDAAGQRSSAYDLALIGRAAMGLADYRRRAVMPNAMFPGGLVTPSATPGAPTTKTKAGAPTLVEGPPFQIDNHNQLLGVYPGVIGVKNGYTVAAQGTYIGAVTHGGRTLIVAEMGSPEPQVHSTPALLDWGFAYAAQARPVGRLVSPGEVPQAPDQAPSTTSVLGTSSSAPAGTAAAVGSSRSSSPAPQPIELALAGAVNGWWSGLVGWVRWAVIGGGVATVGALAALAALVARRRRRARAPRGSYQR